MLNPDIYVDASYDEKLKISTGSFRLLDRTDLSFCFVINKARNINDAELLSITMSLDFIFQIYPEIEQVNLYTDSTYVTNIKNKFISGLNKKYKKKINLYWITRRNNITHEYNLSLLRKLR